MLRDVVEQVAGHALPVRLVAPQVLGAPVPALPRIGLARLDGGAAQKLQQLHHGAVARVHDLRLAVAVLLHQDGAGAVHVVLALDFLGDDVGGLVPADALVLGDAARFRVAVPLRVPVLADERVRDAVARERVLLVGHRGGRDQRVQRLFEDLALVFQPERLQVVHGIGGIVLEGAHAQDPVVFHVDRGKVGADAEAAPVYVVERRLVGAKACGNHEVPPIGRNPLQRRPIIERSDYGAPRSTSQDEREVG